MQPARSRRIPATVGNRPAAARPADPAKSGSSELPARPAETRHRALPLAEDGRPLRHRRRSRRALAVPRGAATWWRARSGKTELLVPARSSAASGQGRRIIHTAQNRELPRADPHPPRRVLRGPARRAARYRGTRVWPRAGAGLRGDPPRQRRPLPDRRRDQRSAARGWSAATTSSSTRSASSSTSASSPPPSRRSPRQHEPPDRSTSATPARTTARSSTPSRSGPTTDPGLAYLEWSAAPERAADDRAGWLEANPAIGHDPGHLELPRGRVRDQPPPGHDGDLRDRAPLPLGLLHAGAAVSEFDWAACRRRGLPPVSRPVAAVSHGPRRRGGPASRWPGGPATRSASGCSSTSPGAPVDADRLGDGRQDRAQPGQRRTTRSATTPSPTASSRSSPRSPKADRGPRVRQRDGPVRQPRGRPRARLGRRRRGRRRPRLDGPPRARQRDLRRDPPRRRPPDHRRPRRHPGRLAGVRAPARAPRVM